jgi:formylglycine-generating enzyme required for sulfatase activity
VHESGSGTKANCKGCGGTYDPAKPLKVGSFKSNTFGLYDMGGNVDQWVEDCWHKGYQGAPADGSAWIDGTCVSRVIRSGSWKNDASYVRASDRDHYDTDVRYPTHGFRIAVSPSPLENVPPSRLAQSQSIREFIIWF